MWRSSLRRWEISTSMSWTTITAPQALRQGEPISDHTPWLLVNVCLHVLLVCASMAKHQILNKPPRTYRRRGIGRGRRRRPQPLPDTGAHTEDAADSPQVTRSGELLHYASEMCSQAPYPDHLDQMHVCESISKIACHSDLPTSLEEHVKKPRPLSPKHFLYKRLHYYTAQCKFPGCINTANC